MVHQFDRPSTTGPPDSMKWSSSGHRGALPRTGRLGARQGEADLVRGAALIDDSASLTSYVLALFDADIQVHDGSGQDHAEGSAAHPLLRWPSPSRGVGVAHDAACAAAPASRHAGPASLSPRCGSTPAGGAGEDYDQAATLCVAERQGVDHEARSQLDGRSTGSRSPSRGRTLRGPANSGHAVRTRHGKPRLAVLEEIRTSTYLRPAWSAGSPSSPAHARDAGVRPGLGEGGGQPPCGASSNVWASRSMIDRRLVWVTTFMRATVQHGSSASSRSRASRRPARCLAGAARVGSGPAARQPSTGSTSSTRAPQGPTVRLRQPDPQRVVGGPRRIERFQIPLVRTQATDRSPSSERRRPDKSTGSATPVTDQRLRNSRLIDTWFPCPEVDTAVTTPAGSGRSEKALFTWFASRPIAQARAAVLCSLLTDTHEASSDVRKAIRGDKARSSG